MTRTKQQMRASMEAYPFLAIEVVIAARHLHGAFPLAVGQDVRQTLYKWGVVTAHGHISPKGEELEDIALPVADAWARERGADSFDAWMAPHIAKIEERLGVELGSPITEADRARWAEARA